ncbi:MAG: hypothetical protein R3A80_08745 [Bdellovibrionota bacterium]
MKTNTSFKKVLLPTTLLAFAGFAQETGKTTEGVYTSIKQSNCVVASSSELVEDAEIDFLKMSCPALGGYEVEISGGDIRYDLKLHYQGENIALPYVGAFHDMGSEVIEWRYSRVDTNEVFGKSIKYQALIYRINSDWTQEDGTLKNVSTLYVVRLDGKNSCAVAALSTLNNPGGDLNKLAVAAAEDNTLKCLSLAD